MSKGKSKNNKHNISKNIPKKKTNNINNIVNKKGFSSHVQTNQNLISVSIQDQQVNNLSHIIDEIKRSLNIHTVLKPLNPFITKKGITFVLDVNKSIFENIIQNYKNVTSFKLHCLKIKSIQAPHKIPKEWSEIINPLLEKRFNPNTGVIDLSNFSQSEELLSNGICLKLNSPTTLNNILNIIKEQITTLNELNLSNNGIFKLCSLKDFIKNVNVLKVDLSNNKINNSDELRVFKDTQTKAINLTSNIFTIKSSKLKEFVKKELDNINNLNGETLEKVLIAGEIIKSTNTFMPDKIATDKNSEVYKIAYDLCEKFDQRNIEVLSNLYTDKSCFTYMSNNNPIQQWKSINSNMKMNGNSKPIRGSTEIVQYLKIYPYSKCVFDSLEFDIQFRSSHVIQFTVYGFLLDYLNNRTESINAKYFSRTISYTSLGKIEQEQLSLNNCPSTLPQIVKTAIKTLRGEIELLAKNPVLKSFGLAERSIVIEFQKATKLTINESVELLKKYGDPSIAFNQFNLMKQNKTSLPNTQTSSLLTDNDLIKKYPIMSPLSLDERNIVLEFHRVTTMNVNACFEFLKNFSNPQEALQNFNIMKQNGQIPPEAY